jgi:hypothetical protein
MRFTQSTVCFTQFAMVRGAQSRDQIESVNTEALSQPGEACL